MGELRHRPAGGGSGIRWRAFVTPWLVLLAGIGLSVSAFYYRESSFESEHADQFDRETSSVLASIAETMHSYEGVVNGLHGLFAASTSASQEDFRWYADSILLETRFPGLWGIAATRDVPSDQVGQFLETGEIIETAGEEYRPGQLDTSYIVTHAEPRRVHVGRGIDARLFEPMSEAMDRSRDTGSIQLGGPFTIPPQPGAEDESDMPTIMVLAKPVFDTQEVPETVAERQRHLYGWVGALIDARPFAATSTGEFGSRYRVEIFDGKQADGDALIAESRRTEADGGRRRVTSREFFGRTWTIRLTEAVPVTHSRSQSLTLLFGGSAISTLLFALLFVTGRSEQRALRMVDRATEALSRKERHFRALVANSNDIITVVDDGGLIQYVSPSAARMLGYNESELLGRDILEHVHPDDAEWLRTGLFEELMRERRAGPIEFRVLHRDGQWRYLEAVAVNLLDDPAVEGIVFNCRDVTERKAFERDLAYQATHDPLTGLPNRSLLLDRLGQALARGSRSGNRPAILFVDLDRFKFVNDSLGHSAGDELLVLVAERLRHTVRPGDTVARFGGDEFVVLAESVIDVAECRAIAERMTGVLASPFCVAGHEVFVTASIGMTIATEEIDTPETLLRDADAAMYRAKEQGRSRSELFDAATYRHSLDRLEIENALHRAIEREELVLHYQPQFDLRTGAVVGAEALLRWQHPERGLVPPLEFIELAEDTGLIVPIGEWVLREACRQGERWRRQLPAGSTFTVSVNLSSRQLAHPQLPGTVMRILSDTNFPAEALSLEITEGSLMQDVTATVHTLDMLKSLGLKLAIDDFGTGYASLGHLNRFPVDSLKIDRHFVDGLGHDSDGTVIVAAVIGLAHALGVTAVAEGVETETQLAELRALRCDAAQGFLFARPAPAPELDLLAPVVDLDLSSGDGSDG